MTAVKWALVAKKTAVIVMLISIAGCYRRQDVTNAPEFWGGYVPGAYYQLQTNGVLFKAVHIPGKGDKEQYLLLRNQMVDENNWPSFTNEWSCFTNLAKGTVFRVDKLVREITMAVQWAAYIEVSGTLIIPQVEGVIFLREDFSTPIKFSGDVYTFLSAPNTNLVRRIEKESVRLE